MLAFAARLVVPLLLFTLFLLFAWACQDHAVRRDGRRDEPADDTDKPDTEPPQGLPAAA